MSKSYLKKFRDLTSEAFIGLVGPAGSGKSTTLMMAALKLSATTSSPVYFLRETVTDLRETLVALEDINEGMFYLFIDKIDLLKNQVVDFLSSARARNVCIIFAERSNIWSRRIKEFLEPFVVCLVEQSRISKNDIDPILNKLQEFGSWTRLEKMSLDQRRKEINEKADNQLLIGLLEATTGKGFLDIIRRDYQEINDISLQKLLVLAGLATLHRGAIASNDLGRALINVEVAEDAKLLASRLEGVVLWQGDRLVARHPIYVRELFKAIVPPELIKECLIGLLQAYADYPAPVAKHLSKIDAYIFKSITNHRFINEVMRRNETLVKEIYKTFETKFHIDGLYWLQYGLALRHFGKHIEALEKLSTARSAFTSPQIEHAYAQQLLINARHATDWIDAEASLMEARKIFENLEVDGWEGDTYPIVSLAEGHIKLVERFKGVPDAKMIAVEYANKLLQARKANSNKRLDSAVTNVTSYSLTGDWPEEVGEDSYAA